MTKSQKNILNKNKIIFFDVDGVLVNSLKNMNISWNSCMKKFGIMKNFSKYSVLIGLPFEDILSNLNIKNNKNLIKQHYGKTSKKNINKITLYPKVQDSLNKLSKYYQLGIVTSKSKGRTFFFLKRFNLIKYFKYISCPQRGIKGKPHSDQMNLIIKKTKIKKKNVIFVGDTIFDEKCAHNAKINFCYANWGYGKRKSYGFDNINLLSKYLLDKL